MSVLTRGTNVNMYNLNKFLLIMLCTIYFMINVGQADWLLKCSNACKCKWISGKKTADCKNSSITNVPKDLSSELQVLDLSMNTITEIMVGEFQLANLGNLHKLFMRNCSMVKINKQSLKGLEILIEIDLSYNLLKQLPRGVFVHLIKIRALILNNNLLTRLTGAVFNDLLFLHRIELKENQLVHLDDNTFINLPSLTQIYLDNNKFMLLKSEPFLNTTKLTSLSLKQNPWNCTCELKIFRDFTFYRNLYTPPTDCYYPENLRGTLWSDLASDAFACKPEILYPLPGASINSSNENVTLTCRIQSTSNTLISWTYNKHSFSLSNYQKRIHIKNISEIINNHKYNSNNINPHQYYSANHNHNNGNQPTLLSSLSSALTKMEMLITELTIVGVKQSDEGVYTCIAQNIGGKDEVDILLSVQKQFNSSEFLQNNFIVISFCISIIVLFITMTIVLLIYCHCQKLRTICSQHTINGKDTVVVEQQINVHNCNNVKLKSFDGIKLNSVNDHHSTITMMQNGTIDYDKQISSTEFMTTASTSSTSTATTATTTGGGGGSSSGGTCSTNTNFTDLSSNSGNINTGGSGGFSSNCTSGGGGGGQGGDSGGIDDNISGCSSFTNKTNLIRNNKHDIKFALLDNKFTSDSSLQLDTSSNSLLLSPPSKHSFIYDKHDLHLPPDLLPCDSQSTILMQNVSYENKPYLTNYEKLTNYRINSQSSHLSPKNASHHLTNKELNADSIYNNLIISNHTNNNSNSIHNINNNINNYNNNTSNKSNNNGNNNNNTTCIGNTTLKNSICKPRQSIVRTSPSFSFLSNGNQQNNFL